MVPIQSSRGITYSRTRKTEASQAPLSIRSKIIKEKKLVSIKTQPKIKVLTWRILNDIIPVRTELCKRGVQCPLLFPVCLATGETINHTFIGFDREKRIWFGSKLNLNFRNIKEANLKEWLWETIQKKGKDNIKDVLIILYSI